MRHPGPETVFSAVSNVGSKRFQEPLSGTTGHLDGYERAEPSTAWNASSQEITGFFITRTPNLIYDAAAPHFQRRWYLAQSTSLSRLPRAGDNSS